MDGFGATESAWSFSQLACRLLVLLKMVVEPALAASVDVAQAKLLLPEQLMPLVAILRESKLVLGPDGQPHRLLSKGAIIQYKWVPGLRMRFDRLALVDWSPPLQLPPKVTKPLPLRNTKQVASPLCSPLHAWRMP